MKKRVLRQIRKMPQNLLRDRQTMEDILDEMAIKWAVKTEKLQNKALGQMQTSPKQNLKQEHKKKVQERKIILITVDI